MSPPALTAGLNGRLGLPPVVMICLDACAKVISVMSAIASTMVVSRRMSRSSKERHCILYADDRKAAVADSGLGCVCDRDDRQEPADRAVRRRENLEPGKPAARAPLHQARAHLVLQ